jgi:hypothetical protein
MPMSYDDACMIVLLESKLYALRGAAAPSQFPQIGAQLDRLDPYTETADNIVLQQSDAQFAAAASALQPQIQPINAAIADITQINNALTTAANIIKDIIAAVGVIGGI